MCTDTRVFPTTAGVLDPECGWLTRHLPRLSRAVALLLAIGLTVTSAARESVATPDTIAASPGAILDLGERPSHGGRYFAEVVSAPAIAVGTPQGWTIRIARHDGRRVANARLAIRTWMPEQDSVSRTIAGITYIGRGRYRVGDMILPKAGWWNVALVIDGSAGVDSVGFNLLLPDAKRAR